MQRHSPEAKFSQADKILPATIAYLWIPQETELLPPAAAVHLLLPPPPLLLLARPAAPPSPLFR